MRIKTKLTVVLFTALLCIGFIGCESNKKDYDATTFLDAVITQAQGTNNWNAIESIHYLKHFELYAEHGDTLINRDESHFYAYDEGTFNSITYESDQGIITLSQENGHYLKEINEMVDTTASVQAIQSSIDAASFVLGLPHTLRDESAALSYNGLGNFQGKSVHTLEVKFEESDDIWYLFYEEDTLDWLGYWVHTDDHYSLVINQEMQRINGYSLPKKRVSYRTDAAMNTTWLRAKYRYSDFEIE